MDIKTFVDNYCREHFGEQTLYTYLLRSTSAANAEYGIKMMMKEYARACCEESLKKASENIAHGPIEGRELEATEVLVVQPKNIVLL